MALWISAAALALMLNAFVTRCIYMAPESSGRQRLIQTVVVWLVPILGAALIFVGIRLIDRPAHRAGRGYGFEATDPGIPQYDPPHDPPPLSD